MKYAWPATFYLGWHTIQKNITYRDAANSKRDTWAYIRPQAAPLNEILALYRQTLQNMGEPGALGKHFRISTVINTHVQLLEH